MSQRAIESRIETLLAAGDRATAVTVAVRGYGPQILGYLQALLRSSDDGDEAFARFCEDLWVGIAGYARQTTFRAWAYTIAWHAALRVAQDPSRKRECHLTDHHLGQLVNQVRTTTAPHLQTRNKMRLAELREALDRSEQTLLILRLDRRMSWREIAEVLAGETTRLSEPALRKRFERVKERLRELAAERGLLPPGTGRTP